MKAFNYQKAIDMGYTPEEIDAFLGENNVPVINKPEAHQTDYTSLLGQPTPTQVPPTPAPAPERLPIIGERIPIPDVVTPMTNNDFIMTQTMGERPEVYGSGGHRGEDLAYIEPNGPGSASTYQMTNPIGGIPFSGYQEGGYGNYQGVIGASPEELAQMSPEDKVRMATNAQDYIGQGSSDISGLSSILPGKNVNLQGHLAEPSYLNPEGIGTGEASLQMGSTGFSDATHLHDEFLDTEGKLKALSEVLNKEIKKRSK